MSKAHVLVVDDDPIMLRLLSANLMKRGFEVTTILDGESAIEQADKLNPDLILLDITLPGIDGFQVCHRIRQWSNVPILMISANAGDDIATAARNCGANGYLAKPFAIDTLLNRINAMLVS